MRKLIAGMKISVDAKFEGPEHLADWVVDWSEEYGIRSRIDACLLGGGMYPGYEQYWTPIQNEPGKPHPLTGLMPTEAEIEWGRFAARTPHHVLSTTLNELQWPSTTLLRGLDEVTALKQQPGKDIYLVGGARLTTSLIDAGLVDELRLIVYPLVAGEGPALFAATEHRRALELHDVRRLSEGRVCLTYGVGAASQPEEGSG
ncbi:dihydrofolate reductase family protein [Spirillospora sp. CA-294931]|uniref:dihydrofolate reductase family protein n=1 Tax=Spirillospora sp. CA-294931 TaxID=3240042 RepID=UPI003D8E309E